ncbi:MAG: phosphotransferase [Bacteroidales bacterium]|nr:phosphotransferase [Bacteroidales bacterium]
MKNHNDKFKILDTLYKEWSGNAFHSIEPLPSSGSYREYYRIKGSKGDVIGVYNEDIEENIAFITFTRHFTQIGLNVPGLYITASDKKTYLIEDLGDTTLHNYLQMLPHSIADNHEKIIAVYKKTIDELIRIQLNGAYGLDFSVAYPRAVFDKQSIMWDLNYFKYYFVKLLKAQFHEQRLEDDFNTFSNHLLKTDCNYFLFRDFQSRNIMLKDNNIIFIDYQGGRKGALQYDIASLLYEAKVNLPDPIREILLNYYLDQLGKQIEVNRSEFLDMYYAYVLIRMMQALGAYGFRGIIERKQLFIDSIPSAVENLARIIKKVNILNELKEMKYVINQLIDSEIIKTYTK